MYIEFLVCTKIKYYYFCYVFKSISNIFNKVQMFDNMEITRLNLI